MMTIEDIQEENTRIVLAAARLIDTVAANFREEILKRAVRISHEANCDRVLTYHVREAMAEYGLHIAETFGRGKA